MKMSNEKVNQERVKTLMRDFHMRKSRKEYDSLKNY